MTLHHRRDNDPLLFTAKTPHFFKIIVDDTIKDGKLGIPKGFVRNYGNNLPNPVLLKVPSGAEWQVGLTKCDGDVWLENGWQEFAEYYSLVHGHFLVFRYNENSHFSVVIFDRSASEIKYPYTVTHGEEYSDSDGEFEEPMIEETEDNVSVEILDDIIPCPKARKRPPLPCPQPLKLMRTISNNKTKRTSKLQTFVSDIRCKGNHSSGEELEDFKGNINSQCSTQELGGGFNSPSKWGGEGTSTGCRGPQSKILRRMQPLTTNEKAERLQRASDFKCDNPFFVLAMQPSHVRPVCQLSVPNDFTRKYFIEKQGDIILYISEGRTWSAKYRRGASNSNPRAKLCGGWREFVQDNHLEVGDVCVFELMNGTEMSLKVVIFRFIEDANGHLSPGNLKQSIHEESSGRQCTERSSCSRVPGALEAASKFISEYPFFKVVFRSTHTTNGVTVPFKFIENLIKQKGEQLVTLQVADRSWFVKLNIYPLYHQGKLHSGWSTFARENSVCVGDVCVFELIRRDDAVLKVSIFRHAG